MRSLRRELALIVAALSAYASCVASSEPSFPPPPVAPPGIAQRQDASIDAPDDGFDAWAYESSVSDAPDSAQSPDAKKEPLPSWWSSGASDSGPPGPARDSGLPSAVVEVLEVNGAVSLNAVRGPIAGNQGRVQACYSSAIARDPSAKGNLRARFIVGANGRVVQAARGAGDLHDQRLIQCLLRVHEGLQFPAAGAPYSISVSIQLEPK